MDCLVSSFFLANVSVTFTVISFIFRISSMDNYSTNLIGLVKAAAVLPRLPREVVKPVAEKVVEFGQPIVQNVGTSLYNGVRSLTNRAMAAGHTVLGNDARAQDYMNTASQYTNKQNQAHGDIVDALGAAGSYGLAALKRGDVALHTLLGNTNRAKKDMDFVRKHDARYNAWKQGQQRPQPSNIQASSPSR